MHCTKIVPPLPSYINTFYYFSYFTLLITVAITPLQFYVISTQSKNLKAFKWLILNHSFWCLCFEISFTSVKPVILTPAIAGYPMGLLKNGNMKLTMVATLLIIVILVISIGALGATLLSRYLLVFPATKWFSKKRGIIFVSVVILSSSGSFCFIFYKFLNIEESEVHKMALQYDPCMQRYISDPGFQFLSHETYSYVLYFIFGLLVGVVFIALLLASYFIYLVKTSKSAAIITKLSKSLMISAIIQLLITLLFNFIPITYFVTVITFEIPNTANLTQVGSCVISCHAFLESIVTLSFVAPYRNFVTQIFVKFFSRFGICVKPASVSPVITQTETSLNYSRVVIRNDS